MITQQILQKLQKFDTPTICNLIELFDVRPRNMGYMDARIMAAFPDMPPIVGFAATATFRSDAAPRQGDAYGSIVQQVEHFAKPVRTADRRLPGPRRPARRRRLWRGDVYDLPGVWRRGPDHRRRWPRP